MLAGKNEKFSQKVTQSSRLHLHA